MTTQHPEVLIVVESKHGATLGIAGAIAQRLVSHGFRAHVTDPRACAEITAEAVIVGSAIYMGKWLKPAIRFLDDHSVSLALRRVWLFSSGPLADDPVAGDAMASADAAELAERVYARDHRIFAGRLDRTELGPVESLIAHGVHAPTGDFRDWQEINEWSDQIAATLHNELSSESA